MFVIITITIYLQIKRKYMKKLTRFIFLVPSVVLVLSTSSVVAVYADNGGDTSGSSGSGSGDSSNSSSSQDTSSGKQGPNQTTGSGSSTNGDTSGSSGGDTTKSSDSHDGSPTASGENPALEVEAEATFRQEGETILNNAMEGHHSNKSAADIAKACQASKHGIETRTTALTGNAQNTLNHITSAFSEVLAFQKSTNLHITDLNTLVVAATTAQTKATTSVQALAALNPTLDCTSASVAAEVTTFQAALGQARSDLIAYRVAVQSLLSAVENAS